MLAVQEAELMALVKAEARKPCEAADHRPVRISNTLAKVRDSAVLEQCQNGYVKEMMPRQIEFAPELLAMGLRMILHIHEDLIIIIINIINAYNEIKRAAVLGAHMRQTHFQK